MRAGALHIASPHPGDTQLPARHMSYDLSGEVTMLHGVKSGLSLQAGSGETQVSPSCEQTSPEAVQSLHDWPQCVLVLQAKQIPTLQ